MMNSLQAQSNAKKGAPDRETIRVELEATRTAFYKLLDSLSETDWRRKSTSTAWTIGELLTHIAASFEYLPEEIEHARKGKNMMNFPLLIFDPLKVLVFRMMTRRETLQSVAQKYETAHVAALKMLDEIQDNEWRKGAKFFGEGYWTIEHIFEHQAEHFAEHAAHIRQSLGHEKGTLPAQPAA